ncbi:hypothetical protein VNO78_10988 [Psophocarpus tetragonolobus]|uniref:Uncharacterized protein n=1 Tax=Psophocarpus tetragonolobus TaxID=3891 RepID=A0AAN9SLJ0_PSOTE
MQIRIDKDIPGHTHHVSSLDANSPQISPYATIQKILAPTTRPHPKGTKSKSPSTGGTTIQKVLAPTTRPPPKGTNSKPITGTNLSKIQKILY